MDWGCGYGQGLRGAHMFKYVKLKKEIECLNREIHNLRRLVEALNRVIQTQGQVIEKREYIENVILFPQQLVQSNGDEA